jgi:hypothetical protein
MINALMCVHKSGDVLGLTLRQLVDSPVVSRILIADGPHLGPIKPGHKVLHPAVHVVIGRLKSDKIVYEHTADCPTRADKNNRVLKHVSDDCDWVLVVDSDEVHHEDGLKRLAKFLKTAEYDRYAVRSINPYPDFRHHFDIDDWKPRVYRWFPGGQCPPRHDRMHQYVVHPKQKTCRGQEPRGVARLPRKVCEFWHLNAMRAGSQRVHPQPDGTIVWKGGKRALTSKLYPLDIKSAPRSIRELRRDTLT